MSHNKMTPTMLALYCSQVQVKRPTPIQKIESIVRKCRYLDWEIRLRMDGNRPYIQVYGNGPDPDTEKVEKWSGRKWFVSPHMCNNEVVRTCFKAIEAAVQHEMAEQFTYCGARIFDPHMNYDLIVGLSKHPDFLDTRDNGMEGV